MKIKLTESEVSQEIDLNKVLGESAEIDSVSDAFSQALLDKIIERTESGRDIHGNILPAYSESYKNSLAFKVYGKTNQVNMTLTGDMLATMFTEQNGSKLKIKFDGDVNNAKAFAHITGFKNHPTLEGKVKKREFFGITDEDLDKIAKEFKPDFGKEAKKNDETILAKLLELFG